MSAFLPVVVLALGVVCGLWLSLWHRGRALGTGSTDGADTQRRDAEERAVHMLEQLRDLELLRDRVAPEAYDSERRVVELAAASALRRRDEHVADIPKSRPQRPLSQIPGFVWGAASATVVALLVTWVASDQKPRPLEAPTSAPAAAGPGASASMSAEGSQGSEMTELLRKLHAEPDNVELQVQVAHLLLRRQALREAQMVTDRTLELSPKHPEALVHRAVIRSGNGDAQGALEDLGGILKEHPKLAEGWLFRGMIAMQSGASAVMKESFEQFVAHAPEGPQRDRIQTMLEGGGINPPPQLR